MKKNFKTKILFFSLLILLLMEVQSSPILLMNRICINNSHTFPMLQTDRLFYNIFTNIGDFFINLGEDFSYQKAVSANFISAPEKEIIPEPQPPEPVETPFEKTISANSGNVTVTDKISIKNMTSYKIDTDAILEQGVPFTISNSSPTVLILHTHATESFTPSEKYNFTHTSNTRTTDENYNVVRLGRELSQTLTKLNVSNIHDTTLYDYPDYNSSYDNAFYGIRAMLNKYPGISIIIDLHRDAVNTETGETVKLTGEVNGEKAAQLMFVVGTDECGFSHPNWERNLKFASLLQQHLYSISPELVRPIMLRTSRFNQHFRDGSLIVEVGTNGNTLDEALVSIKYLAQSIKNTVEMLKT